MTSSAHTGPRHRILPRTRSGWVAVLLPLLIPVSPFAVILIGVLVNRANPSQAPGAANPVLPAMIVAVVSIAIGWTVIIRNRDRAALVWIVTTAVTLLLVALGVGEAFWWE